MPTNVSTPIWCCDICATRFDANRDAAQRCEDAGPPTSVPDGSLLLDYSDRHGDAGFRLRRLYRVPGVIGTLASRFSDAAGHTVSYVVDVDPALLERSTSGTIRWPDPPPRRIDSQHLVPHAAGVLNLLGAHWLGAGGHGGVLRAGATWVLEAVGLADPDGADHVGDHQGWARPLTAPVKAILDALYVRIRPLRRDEVRLGHGYGLDRDGPLSALALQPGRAGPTGRPTSRTRAAWYLRSTAVPPLVDEINDRWQRWRDGEPITVPTPRLWINGEGNLTASRLKHHPRLRDLVTATGFPWPPRTYATDYARLLVDHALGYAMDTTDRLFDVAHLIAVRGGKGGVGKSTVAAALARRLAGRGHRVVLVDVDVTGPSQHLLFQLGPVPVDERSRRILPAPTDQAGLQVFSPGQLFGPAAKVTWTRETTEHWLSFVGSSLALDDADVVVLDLPPGDTPVHRLLFTDHLVRVTTAVHVTTGHPLALADTERGLAVLSHHGPRHRRVLVENMSRVAGTATDGQQVEVRILGVDGATAALAATHRATFAGSLPWQPDVAALAGTDEIGVLADLALDGGAGAAP